MAGGGMTAAQQQPRSSYYDYSLFDDVLWDDLKFDDQTYDSDLQQVQRSL